jgi:hypothetical protein
MEMMTVPHSRSRISLAPSKPKSSSKEGGAMCGGAMSVDDVMEYGKSQLMAYLAGKLREKKGGKIQIPIRMSATQRRKMMKGGAVTITPAMIDEKAGEIMELLPASAKKVIKSILKNKGVRHALQMGESMMKSGGGPFEDLARSAKKTFSPDLGRKIAKVLINEAVPALIQTATSSAVGGVTGNPYLGMVAGQTAGKTAGEEARDAINKRAGFGMKKVPIRQGMVKVGCGRSKRLIDQQFSIKDAGNFVMKELPSAFGGSIMSDAMDMMPQVSVGFRKKRGGSFMPAGGSIYPAGKYGGMLATDMDAPIQLGSPYINTNSPANNPFMPSHSQLSGYNKIK